MSARDNRPYMYGDQEGRARLAHMSHEQFRIVGVEDPDHDYESGFTTGGTYETKAVHLRDHEAVAKRLYAMGESSPAFAQSGGWTPFGSDVNYEAKASNMGELKPFDPQVSKSGLN